MSLARMFLSARENAQRCAVDCAPYVHAKLQGSITSTAPPVGGGIASDSQTAAIFSFASLWWALLPSDVLLGRSSARPEPGCGRRGRARWTP